MVITYSKSIDAILLLLTVQNVMSERLNVWTPFFCSTPWYVFVGLTLYFVVFLFVCLLFMSSAG